MNKEKIINGILLTVLIIGFVWAINLIGNHSARLMSLKFILATNIIGFLAFFKLIDIINNLWKVFE